MAENFPNLRKDTDIQIQETQRLSNKMNPKRSTPRHVIIKMSKNKDKEGIFKSSKRKLVTSMGTPLYVDFSAKSLQARGREWFDILKVLQEKTCHQVFCNLKLKFYSGCNLTSKIVIQNKKRSFSRQEKLEQVTMTNPALQEMLKGLL